MPAPTTLILEVADAVATITLNRPDRLNAYTATMGVELFDLLHQLDLDDGVRAIVVTGAGRAFCAGADLGPAGGDTFAGDAFSPTGRIEPKVMPWNMRKPVIAAINGPAVGIGATLSLWWDIRLASDRARIGFVFVRRGIVPEAASTWLLPRLVGMSRAMELMLTGRLLTASEALEHGLVSRVLPHDELLGAARALGREIAETTGPVAVAITKRLLWRQLLELDPRRGKATEDRLFRWAGRSPDAAEGVRAFLEKRAPRWTMSAAHDLPEDLDDLESD